MCVYVDFNKLFHDNLVDKKINYFMNTHTIYSSNDQ